MICGTWGPKGKCEEQFLKKSVGRLSVDLAWGGVLQYHFIKILISLVSALSVDAMVVKPA